MFGFRCHWAFLYAAQARWDQLWSLLVFLLHFSFCENCLTSLLVFFSTLISLHLFNPSSSASFSASLEPMFCTSLRGSFPQLWQVFYPTFPPRLQSVVVSKFDIQMLNLMLRLDLNIFASLTSCLPGAFLWHVNFWFVFINVKKSQYSSVCLQVSLKKSLNSNSSKWFWSPYT